MAHWVVRHINNRTPKKCKSFISKKRDAGAYIEQQVFGGRICFSTKSVYFLVENDTTIEAYKIGKMLKINFVRRLVKGKTMRDCDFDWDVTDSNRFMRASEHEEAELIEQYKEVGNIAHKTVILPLITCNTEAERFVKLGLDPSEMVLELKDTPN